MRSTFSDIIAIEEDKELGVVTRVFGTPPIKGRVPDKYILAHLDGAKSVITFLVWLSRYTPLLFFLALSKKSRKIVTKYLANAIRKNLYELFEVTSINHFTRSCKEIARVIDIRNPCSCSCHVEGFVWTSKHDGCQMNEEKETETVIKFGILMMFDFDDAYRYRLQDLLGEIKIDLLKKKPRRELARVLSVGIKRETNNDANKWLMFPKYRVAQLVVFLMPRKWLRWTVNAISNMDMSKVELDEDDLFYAQFKEYDFRGRPYRSLVNDKIGFIIDIDGKERYLPKRNEILFSYSAIKPNG